MDMHLTEHDVHCIATAVYTEANTQSLEEKLGVIHVIANRVRSKKFGKDACEVVYARGQFIGVTNMLSGKQVKPNKRMFLKTQLLVLDTLVFKKYSNPVANSLYFHDDSIDMRFIWNKKKVVHIGRMVFY
jgi:spore germination cell wall hydrolase CwlJ-like protein